MTEIQIQTDVPDEAADIISAAIEGALIIKTDEGEKIIRTGEVSVRGLYGYV